MKTFFLYGGIAPSYKSLLTHSKPTVNAFQNVEMADRKSSIPTRRRYPISAPFIPVIIKNRIMHKKLSLPLWKCVINKLFKFFGASFGS